MFASIAVFLGIVNGVFGFGINAYKADQLRSMTPAQARMIERCADAFKSYRPDTGMWIDYQGKHHHCPKI